MLCVVLTVVLLPPATIWPIAPKYCGVVGVLRLVSVPFHSATSCVRRSPSMVSGEVLGLEVGELALLVAEFDVEEVVVDLRDKRLERHAAFDTGRGDQRGNDVARIHEGAGCRGCRNCRLLGRSATDGRWQAPA